MSELEGKVALITGGASGLGAATARAVAAAGGEVVVVDVDEERGAAVADEVGGAFTRADVSRLAENEAMVAFAVERFGGLDLVHLNAGITSEIGVGDEFDVDRYRKVMGVNLDGVVFGTVAALPALLERGGGAIVATSSLAGLTAVPYDPFYAANKHAVVGLARSLGPGLAEQGVRFNAICPSFAESAIIAPIRDALVEQGVAIVAAETVADTVVRLFTGDETGECWYIQAGREPEAFGFRGIPGARV